MYNPNPKKVGTFCKMQQNQESCDLLIPFNIYLIDKSKKKKRFPKITKNVGLSPANLEKRFRESREISVCV